MRMEPVGRPVPHIGSPVVLDAERFAALSSQSAPSAPQGGAANGIQPLRPQPQTQAHQAHQTQALQQKGVFARQPAPTPSRPVQGLGENRTPIASIPL